MRAALLTLFAVACASPPPQPPVRPAPMPAAEAPPVATASAPAELAEPEPPTPPPEPPTPPPEPEPAPTLAEPAPPADAPPSVPEPPPPAAQSSVAANARDPRTLARRPRSRALLVIEIQALERLYAATPRSAADRPLLMRRLAEGYVELEYAAEKEADGAKLVKAARKNAVKYYLAVRDQYPTFAKLDEILYYAGYERERGGELAQARALYRELAKKFPSSPFRARIPTKSLGR